MPRDLPVSPERLSYIVVEEMIGDAIGLSVCDWPEVDDQGRLKFVARAILVGVERGWLEEQLLEHRTPHDIAERGLRIGDVFAAADVELRAREEESQLTISTWTPPINDLTAEARDAAKTAFYGAVAPVLDPGQARDLDELVEEVDG
jgi:hypothetical protein